jgi:hypothetical protein
VRAALLALVLAACGGPGESGPYVKSVVPYGASWLLVERCTLIVGENGLREGSCDKKMVPLTASAPPGSLPAAGAPRAQR